jgi:GAF domain-containing protein
MINDPMKQEMTMLKRVGLLLTPPNFPEDEDRTRRAKSANVIAIVFLLTSIAFEVAVRWSAGPARLSPFDWSLVLVTISCIASLVLLRRGHVLAASALPVIVVWLAANGLAATGFGASDPYYLANFAIILTAGLLLGWQGSLIVTVLSIIAGFALAGAEQNALSSSFSYPDTWFARDIAFIFVLNGLILYLLISGRESALKKSRLSLATLDAANAALSRTREELQVRSVELGAARDRLEDQYRRLGRISLISRAATSRQDFGTLLETVAEMIGDLFGYHHIGLFQIDQQGEFAVLRASNSGTGQALIHAGFRVPVEHTGPIGLVWRTGQPQLVPGVGDGLHLLGEHALADTRSELVLPLKWGEQIIGILDLQASEEHAFSEQDIPILSVLADQVAFIMKNAFLFEESRRAFNSADLAANQATRQGWDEYGRAIQPKGYRYDGIKSEPVNDVEHAHPENHSLSIPIQLRGQTIGRFKLNPSEPSRSWTDDELGMVKATADRVALALEGTRLLDEAQKRAAREAFLSELSSKLSASFRLESILRDTVQELGQTLENSSVAFELVRPAGKSTGYSAKPGASDG